MNAPASGIQTLDQLLHFPELDVLLGGILTHFCGADMLRRGKAGSSPGIAPAGDEVVVKRTNLGPTARAYGYLSSACISVSGSYMTVYPA